MQLLDPPDPASAGAADDPPIRDVSARDVPARAVSASVPPLDRVADEWLAAMAARSHSPHTASSYREAFTRFRRALAADGLRLDSDPARVAGVAQRWAQVDWRSGAPTSAATGNQRLAILSSFYRFALRRGAFPGPNPLERVERRRVAAFTDVRALPPDEVRRRLAAIDQSTLRGLRDHALLTIALYTGRRAAELAGLRWGDVERSGPQLVLVFRRTKGGEPLRDALPPEIGRILLTYLEQAAPAGLAALAPTAPLWVHLGPRFRGRALGYQGVAGICARHLGTPRVHTTRHTFARALEQAGAPLSEIQRRLGHANVATTSRYLTALRSADNPYGHALTTLLGLAGDQRT
jgi:integrase/recombinase XerD